MKEMNLFGTSSTRPKGRGSSGSIHGVQQKWYDPVQRVYYKLDAPGRYQGLVEYLMSQLLDVITVDGSPVPHVAYWLEDVNGATVTASKSFLDKGERELSLATLIELDAIMKSVDADSAIPVDTKLATIINSIARCYLLPELPKMYGVTMLLDYLFWNEDRHWSNFSIIQGFDCCRITPLFDNGEALQVSVLNTTYSRERFEPRPYNADQLLALRLLLGNTMLTVNRSVLDVNSIVEYLQEYYPHGVVSRYLEVAMGLLVSITNSQFAQFVEVR